MADTHASVLDTLMQTIPRPVRAPHLKEMKRRGEPIAILTAYDAVMAHLFERSGVDVILVGDSVGMVALGYASTIPVTIDMMVHHTQAVVRGTSRALIIADMPFLAAQVSVSDAVANAGRLVQQGGAAAVKIEGGHPVVDTVRRLVDVGIPVMGHLGLQPQSVHQIGGFRKRATERADADQLMDDARALEEAGAFAVVLESIPAEVAEAATRMLTIPTIGIGAGPWCDGQVLVGHDMLGFSDQAPPSFVRQYAHLAETIAGAAADYVRDVKEGRFPERAVPAGTAHNGE